MGHSSTKTPPQGFNLMWSKVPIIIRGILLGLLILIIGQLPTGFIFFNLQFTPGIPWFLPIILIWLWLFWRYLNGWGWPASTAQIRNQRLRAHKISAKVWFWSLLAGGIALISILGLTFFITQHFELPAEAYEAPFDVTSFPAWTVFSYFVSIAITAGVVEEAAFRGYMLSLIQARYGWQWGILISGIAFYVVHLSHAYATVVFLPFFLAYSILHGYLVYLTRSILPSVLLHALGDVTILPMQYGILKNIGEIPFVHNGWMSLIMALMAVPLFYNLSKITRAERAIQDA
jgi:membrane protease YdiL (CAAX protease family)